MNDSQPVFAYIMEVIENGIIGETWYAGTHHIHDVDFAAVQRKSGHRDQSR
jgi:hypothetical protein